MVLTKLALKLKMFELMLFEQVWNIELNLGKALKIN